MLASNLVFVQLNNFKNFEDGVAGRILSYNDLSDRKTFDGGKNKKDGSDDDSEDEEEMEKKRFINDCKKFH